MAKNIMLHHGNGRNEELQYIVVPGLTLLVTALSHTGNVASHSTMGGPWGGFVRPVSTKI